MVVLTAVQMGAAGEAAVAAAFLLQGVPVYLPMGDEGVDLVADINGRLQRVQVKSCSTDAPIVRFRLTRRRGTRVLGGASWDSYAEKIDWFALYSTVHNRVLLIRPTSAATQAVQFAPTSGSQWRESSILAADDCDISAVLARIYEEER